MESSSDFARQEFEDKEAFRKRNKLDLEEVIYNHRRSLTFLLLGFILLGLGVIFYKGSSLFDQSPKIEVLESVEDSQERGLELVVEISGAVQNPGVYKLPGGARVEDLLIAAGGLAADADRDWVERVINRAAKLTDGQKIYIPKVGEQTLGATAKNNGGIKIYQGVNTSSGANLVDVNSAGQNQLEDLPGIGPVYAQSIIEHRPYSTPEELLSKGAVPKHVFEKIKDLVSVY